MRFVCFLFCFVVGAVSVLAEVAGEQDPAFRSVLQDWLEGTDDLEALRDLAELARDGNTAARITLGLIERHQYQSLAASMKREDRRAIFRDPDGRFGEPWLRVAGRNNAYAAVRAAPMSPENLDTAFAAGLAEGDLRYAWQVAMIDMNHAGLPSAMHRLTHPTLLPHSITFLNSMLDLADQAGSSADVSPDMRRALDEIRDALNSTQAPENLGMALATRMNGLADLKADPEAMRGIGSTLLGEPTLEPIASFLRRACPEDTDLHMGVLASALSLYPLTLLQESPLVPIVDTETWQRSARFGPDTVREIAIHPPNRDMIAERSACLASLVDSH